MKKIGINFDVPTSEKIVKILLSPLFLLKTIFKSEHQKTFIIAVYHEINVFIVFVPEN